MSPSQHLLTACLVIAACCLSAVVLFTPGRTHPQLVQNTPQQLLGRPPSSLWQQIVQARKQRHLDAAIAQLSAQEAAELAAEGYAQGSSGAPASVPWSSWGASQRVPLLPSSVAWLLYEMEQELANQTSGGAPFDIDKATTLAKYTSVVYCNTTNIQAWNCSRCHQAGPLTPYTTVFDPVWDLMAYAGYSSSLGAKLVVFRGTDSHSLYNWVENMRYWRTDISVPFPNATGALVHAGFLASYNMSTLRENLTSAYAMMNKWHPFAPTYVVGHSLGGALATLCALDLKFTFGLKDVRVYTFGSPRVGNGIFAEFFDAQFKESFRMTHNRDIVPSVPLQLMGFHHVPREVWEVEFAGHSAITVCDTSGEDRRCHDSMCYLGLCTSVTDHLTYLGAHMYHSDAGC